MPLVATHDGLKAMHFTGMPRIPSDRRWMMFVDGENFMYRGLAVAKEAGLRLPSCDYYRPDAFLWIPGTNPVEAFTGDSRELLLHPQSIRSHYYTSVVGDDAARVEVRRILRGIDFDPHVFKKPRQDAKSKGVDIALTTDVLSHAFMGNYDVAVIIAGDGDYIPLVEEVKRLGKLVFGCFFGEQGLNPEFRLTCDAFIDITLHFVEQWQKVSAHTVENPASQSATASNPLSKTAIPGSTDNA